MSLGVRRLELTQPFANGARADAFVPFPVEDPHKSRILEIDPSSPILVVRVASKVSGVDAYVLGTGDGVNLEPGTGQIYLAPHANYPSAGNAVERSEGSIPLLRLSDPERYRRPQAAFRPGFYRFAEYLHAGDAPDHRRSIRFAAPYWDGLRIWFNAVYGAGVSGTVTVVGEHSSDAEDLVTTAISGGAVAIPGGGSQQWYTVGDLGDPTENPDWVRLDFDTAAGGVPTNYSIRVGLELFRVPA